MAYTLFRTSVRCLQVPMTLLVGTYVVEKQDKGHDRLSRLTGAFSLLKLAQTLMKVLSASLFSTLYAQGVSFSVLAWWSGATVAGISCVLMSRKLTSKMPRF